ncbi:hypothetical protein ACFWJU_36525, partial [Streptomyces mutabilis]
ENLAGIRQNALEALTELRRVLGVLRSEHPDALDGTEGGDTAAPHPARSRPSPAHRPASRRRQTAGHQPGTAGVTG